MAGTHLPIRYAEFCAKAQEQLMHSLERQFADGWDLSVLTGVTSVVAVSGGSDSVSLLRLLTRRVASPHQLLVAHFNHGWREAASEDELFVQRLATALCLPFHVGRADHSASRSEAVGRRLRYDFLTRIANEQGARYLLTGHTADDQAETVLFHVLRGSGLRGLRGIPETRRIDESLTLRRPLLNFRRDQLVRYLGDLGQAFQIDATNTDVQFTRNQIRHELMPQIERTIQGDSQAALCRLAGIAREALDEIRPIIDDALERSVTSQDANTVNVNCEALRDTSPFIIREVLAALWQRMGWSAGDMAYAKWRQLAHMVASSEESVVTLPGNVRATRAAGTLQLASCAGTNS